MTKLLRMIFMYVDDYINICDDVYIGAFLDVDDNIGVFDGIVEGDLK